MLEYVLICTVFGMASALVAHSKARNALGWFITGIILGPFALIVGALPLALKEGETKRCTQCTEVIRHQAQICRHCGSPAQLLQP
jgi:hypothetical protein